MLCHFSYQLTFEAEQEYLNAVVWYEEKREGLGKVFIITVRQKLQLISTNPSLYSKKKGNLRIAQLVKPFPYVIVFFIDNKNQQIVITSIFHTSRNPKGKFSR